MPINYDKRNKQYKDTIKAIETLMLTDANWQEKNKLAKEQNEPLNVEYAVFYHWKDLTNKAGDKALREMKKLIITILTTRQFGKIEFDDYSVEIKVKYKEAHHDVI